MSLWKAGDARLFRAPHRRRVLFLLAAVTVCVLAGGALFALTQHLPLTTGLYWALTTATTVGYGDVTPRNATGRLVASAVMLTSIPILAAMFALLTGGIAADGVRRFLDMQTRFPQGTYRLVIGMHPAVPLILDELVGAGAAVVLAADVDPASVRAGVHLVRGDPTQSATISSARPEGAQQALVTGVSDGDVLVSAVIVRKRAPGLPVTALVSSPAVREALRELGVWQTLSTEELIARTLATTLETPHAGELITQLVDSSQHILTEMEADPAMVGKRLSAVRIGHPGLVLGIVHDGTVTLGVREDPLVEVGDHLLVADIARHGQLAARGGQTTVPPVGSTRGDADGRAGYASPPGVPR
jgi:voltage-gated potassium channel